MDEIFYKTDLKNKKTKLIESLEKLDNTVLQKIKEKNELIEEIKNNSAIVDSRKIELFKEEKNKELNNFKKELAMILNDVNNIIENITK